MRLPMDFLRANWKTVVERVACPIPHDQFFDVMTPRGKAPKDLCDYDFTGLDAALSEQDACRILTQAAAQLCPDLNFVYTAPSENPDVKDDLRPQLACYAKDAEITNIPAKDWQTLEMFVYFANDGMDPWPDFEAAWTFSEQLNGNPTAPEALHRQLIAAYAKLQMVRQHRNFLYSIGLYGRYVRFFLWDHAGVAVSERSDCLVDRNTLAEFLQRFNNLDRKWRGWDEDVGAGSEAHRNELTEGVMGYLVKVRRGVQPMIPFWHETLDTRWPVWVVDLKHKPYAAIGRKCRLIIGRYVWHDNATGYIAWEPARHRLVFYKNSCVRREGWALPLSEGTILRQLEERSVSHLPIVYYGTGSCTSFPRVSLNQLFETKNHGGKLLRDCATMHVQHVEEILYPLTYIRNSRQLVSAIRDVLDTLYQAHRDRKYGVSHLDVNCNNIMLTISGEGILADWGIACDDIWCKPGPWGAKDFRPLDDGSQNPSQTTFKPDLESCFWTLIFSAEFSIPSDAPPGQHLSTFVDNKREEFIVDHEQTPLEFECAPFTRLIKNMRSIWASVYKDAHAFRIRAASFDDGDDVAVIETENHDYCVNLARRMVALCTDVLYVDGWLEDDAVRHRIHRQSLNLPPAELDPCLGDLRTLDGATYGQLDHFILPLRDLEKPSLTGFDLSTEQLAQGSLKRRNFGDFDPEDFMISEGLSLKDLMSQDFIPKGFMSEDTDWGMFQRAHKKQKTAMHE